jgi:hypothetical protein
LTRWLPATCNNVPGLLSLGRTQDPILDPNSPSRNISWSAPSTAP